MTKHYGATLCMQPGALWMLHLPASTHVERRINRSAFGNDAATFLAELKYTPLSDVPKRTHGRRTYTVGFFGVTRDFGPTNATRCRFRFFAGDWSEVLSCQGLSAACDAPKLHGTDPIAVEQRITLIPAPW